MSPTRSAKRDSAKRQLKAQHQEVEHSAQCESGHYCRTANRRGKLLHECSGGWRIPLLGQEGWTRPQEMLRSDLMKGADGVVHRAERFGNASRNIHLEMTTPSAPSIGGLRQHLLMAQPPLLSQEGNSLSH